MSYHPFGRIPTEIIDFKTATISGETLAPSARDRAAARSLYKIIKDGKTRITKPHLAKWLQEMISTRKKGEVIMLLKQLAAIDR